MRAGHRRGGRRWGPLPDLPGGKHEIDERVGALLQSVEHITKNAVPGAFVECGVWRGGSGMAAALAFQQAGELRDIYLFDTFEGMSRPTEADVSYLGHSQLELWGSGDAKITLDEVQAAMRSTGYTAERLHYIKASSRTPSRPKLRPRSRFCAWTRIGTSQRGMSWSSSGRLPSPAGC